MKKGINFNALVNILEGLVGFEPTIRELQSHALPLGYRPKINYKHNITL